MQLFSLDKKLLTLQHRLGAQEMLDLVNRHNISEADLEADLRRQLYQKFMEGVATNIPTTVTSDDVSGEPMITYTVRGYVLNDIDMLNVIKECLEMDSDGKRLMLEQINKQLGIKA